MTAPNWKKITEKKAKRVSEKLELTEPALALLKRGAATEAFVEALFLEELWPDAVKVLANSVPPREGVWWSCLCAREAKDWAPKSPEVAAIEAAEKWVYKPTPEHRWEAQEVAMECSAGSVAMLAAMAAAFSGGELKVGNAMAPAPEPQVCPGMVGSAVMLAAVAPGAEGMNERYKLFMEMGMDIANGGTGKLNE